LVLMNSDAFQTEILEVAQSAINYRKWLARLTFPYLGSNPLEFGSGIGDYAKEWLLLGLTKVTVSENSPSRLAMLRDVFSAYQAVETKEIDIESLGYTDEKYSSVVSLNVIEHLKNDHAALLACHKILENGGYFVAFTPAFPFLMSEFDKSVGHHRRYTKRHARELLIATGFEVVTVKYVNSIGWLAWLVGMKLLRLNPKDGFLLKIWDRLIIPLVAKSESWITPPFGQSILIVGRAL
jgi:SAM-dependent methyltransferase